MGSVESAQQVATRRGLRGREGASCSSPLAQEGVSRQHGVRSAFHPAAHPPFSLQESDCILNE